MKFCKCSRRVTPLYRNLVVLKINDVCWLETAKCMHKFKTYDKFFQNISSVHFYKTRFANNQIYFIQKVSINYGKKVFLSEELRSGQK